MWACIGCSFPLMKIGLLTLKDPRDILDLGYNGPWEPMRRQIGLFRHVGDYSKHPMLSYSFETPRA